MKNKHLLRKFMTENNIDFNVPFIVVNGKHKIKYRIIEKTRKPFGTIPQIEYYYNEEEKWEEADLHWLILIMFSEENKIIKPAWKPEDDEEFWYITPNGNICSMSYDSQATSDIVFFLIGNCFKNKKEAEENKEKMLRILNRDKPFIDLNPLNKE